MKTAALIFLLVGFSIFTHNSTKANTPISCDSTYIDTIVSCFPYFWDVTDTTYFFSGIYSDTFQTAQGCDSIRVLNATIYTSYISTTSAFICQGEEFIWNNRLLFQSGTYFDTLQTVNGCDSVLRLNLTVDPVDTSVTRIGNTLRANLSPAASYQWFNCDGDSLIPGAAGRFFTPSRTGIYKVRVNDFGCIDFSNCYAFILSNLQKEISDKIRIFPNPVKERIFVELPENLEVLNTRVVSMTGAEILCIDIRDLQNGVNTESLNSGMYHLVLEGKDFREELRFVKE